MLLMDEQQLARVAATDDYAVRTSRNELLSAVAAVARSARQLACADRLRHHWSRYHKGHDHNRWPPTIAKTYSAEFGLGLMTA